MDGVQAEGLLGGSSQKWVINQCDPSPAADEKPLHWVGSSKRDFLSFPATLKDDTGNALGIAQFGGTSPTAKPWKGLGPGVLEISESHDGNAYRAVYTVRFEKSRVRPPRVSEEVPVRSPNREAGC